MVSEQTSDKDVYIKQLEEKVDQLENIIALLPGNVYWLDTDGYFLGCNNITAEVLHLDSPKDIIGKTTKDVVPNNYEMLEANNREVFESGKLKITEEIVDIENEGMLAYITRKVPLRNRDNEIIGLLGVSIDITDRKKMEKELHEAKEKAEIADQTKTEFLRNMEHDIRTPLSGIISVTNYLKLQEENPQNKELLTDIELSSNELLEYLNSILEFSHISTGEIPVQLKEFNLKKIIESIFMMEQAAAKSRHLSLLMEYPASFPDSMVGDRFRVHRALLNLVSNSIKFTDKGHVKIWVNIEKDANNVTMLHIAVEDTGIGITEEHQSTIFDKFARAYPANRGLYKGTGLGLRIVKQFMDELGGSVSLRSEAGKGSTFTLAMPVSLIAKNQDF